MAQAPTKHEDPHKDHDRRDDRREAEGALVLPLAEPGPGEPLVGARSVKDEWIPDGERDPGTIAEEQRRRSALVEAGATMEEVATTDLPDPTEHQGKSLKAAEKRDAEIHKSAPPPHPSKK